MLRVVQIGLGPIGLEIARRAHERSGLELVGAVDPALVGKDLGELLGTGPLSLRVVADLDELERAAPTAELALHATGSFLPDVAGQLRSLLGSGLAVVSTCEELAYPYYRHPDLTRELDGLAREAGRVLLGTGVNPGFVMDKLVATLTGACTEVRKLRVERVVDAATRRGPFQRKIGSGLAPAEFEERAHGGRLGHIGLAESAHMLADVIGIGPERRLREGLRPVIAERPLATEHVRVDRGQVAGIDQHAVIHDADGAERVRMDLLMVLGAADPRDAAWIDGSPSLEMTVGSGVPGDLATAAVVVNCAPLVTGLAPGLRTMLDVPIRHASGTG